MKRFKHKLNKVASHPYLLLTLRVFVGGVFFLFAFGKAIQPLDIFFDQIKAFQLFPEVAIPFLATLLVGLELLAGAFLIIGFWTRYAAIGAAVMCVLFIVVIGQAVLRGIELTDCGCSGGLIQLGEKPPEVLSRDLILFAGAAWVAASKGRSAWSIDRLLEPKTSKDAKKSV